MEEEKPLIKLTSEQFIQLANGETINHNIRGKLNIIKQYSFEISAVFKNIIVEEAISVNERLKYDVVICGNSSLKGFYLYEKALGKNFTILGHTSIGGFLLLGDARIKNVVISDNVKVDSIQIQRNSIAGGFMILHNAEIGNFKISDNASVKALIFNHNAICLGDILLRGGTLSDHLVFENLVTDKIAIKGSGTKLFPNNDNRITISNTQCNAILFEDFASSKGVQINNVRLNDKNKESYIGFVRSSFSNLELINNEFENFDKVVFENSNITSSFIAETSFPDKVVRTEVVEKDDKTETVISKEHDSLQAKLFFEQLKTVFTKQGNRSKALEYQAKELAQINAMTKLKFNMNSIAEKSSLWFNKWSSNYGTNWIWAFGIFIVGTIVLYSCVLLATEKVTFNHNICELSKETYYQYLGNYFEFLNPTKSLSKWGFINDRGINAKVHFWHYLGKVFIIIMGYQIVQAFRKFSRK